MNKLITIISMVFILITFPRISHSQNSVVSSGNDISGNGETVSYSVGQIAFNTYSGINGSVAQGVQQAYEIFILTGTDDIRSISLNFIAYPNPTTDFLNLKIENFTAEKLFYQLFDMNGRLLINRKIDNAETTIPMQEYVSATYYLKIIKDQGYVKTFKIIKH